MVEGGVTGYCVRCRTKVDLINPVKKFNAKNVPMMQSDCGTCKSKVNRFVRRDPPADGEVIVKKRAAPKRRASKITPTGTEANPIEVV